jgi:5S rRNA maturation endonuclease (ribonuclease M5)
VSVISNLRVVIATHSTAIISAFSKGADLQIIPISNKEQDHFFEFKRSNVCEQVLPVFGAHPLSSTFNLSPIILVEGEDDKRVLEQIVRSSNGKIIFSPCVVGTVSELGEWENWLNQFLPVLYDSPKAYSLRDLDDSQQTDIDDVGVVCRIRLNCYAIENFLLCDECFSAHGLTADKFKSDLEKWLVQYPQHKFAANIDELIKRFDERRTIKIKNIRTHFINTCEAKS